MTYKFNFLWQLKVFKDMKNKMFDKQNKILFFLTNIFLKKVFLVLEKKILRKKNKFCKNCNLVSKKILKNQKK